MLTGLHCDEADRINGALAGDSISARFLPVPALIPSLLRIRRTPSEVVLSSLRSINFGLMIIKGFLWSLLKRRGGEIAGASSILDIGTSIMGRLFVSRRSFVPPVVNSIFQSIKSFKSSSLLASGFVKFSNNLRGSRGPLVPKELQQ